jgi:hypothetical protein
MPNIRDTLTHLRQLRLSEASNSERASDYLYRSTNGTSSKRAADIGGTGHCPLTDFAGRYSQARNASIGARREADAIWKRIEPHLMQMDLDTRSVITLFYNMATPWEDIPAAIKRSPKACERMHREALAALEREPW